MTQTHFRSPLTLAVRASLVGLVATSAGTFAQEVSIATQPAAGAQRYTIETKLDLATERTILRDGEELGGGAGGRGGFGGPSAQKATSRIVFDEGMQDGVTVRTYRGAAATVTAANRDGEDEATEIEGGYIDETLFILEDDRGMVITRGEIDGEELPRFAAMGMPQRTSLVGITPEGSMKVGDEFAFPAQFLSALEGLNHPVRPEMEGFPGGPGGFGGRGRNPEGGDDAAPRRPRGGDQGDGDQGDGGDGAGAGGRRPRGGADAEGGRPQRGGGDAAGARNAFRRMRGVPGNEVWQLIANTHLKGDVRGKLVAVENGIAKIEITAERSGEGSAEELGLQTMGGMFGGRGGRGGRGGQGAGGQGGGGFGGAEVESNAEVSVKLTGELWVDTKSHTVTRLALQGSTSSSIYTSMEMRESVIESDQASESEFAFTVEVAAAPGDGDK